jgi:hypothetical protein
MNSRALLPFQADRIHRIGGELRMFLVDASAVPKEIPIKW